MNVAVLTKNNSNKLRDVGDINAKALYNNLKNLGVDAYLVYFKSDKKDSSRETSIWKALLQSYDIIYASSPKRVDSIFCILFALFHFRPLYISIFDSTLSPITKNYLSKTVFRLLYRTGIIKLFAVSKYQQKVLTESLNITPPILFPCLLSFGYNKSYRKTTPPTITFAGSTNNQKRGIDTLLLALNLLVKKHPDIRIRILNKFTKNERWSETAPQLIKKLKLEKFIKNVGYVKSMSNEYKKSWAYVLPFNETLYIPPLPFTMIEAMSFSVPVISSDIQAFRELLPSNHLIPPGDHHLLANKINEIISHKAKTSIPQQYYPENVSKEFLKLTGRYLLYIKI
ncbi:glycosyltransferase [Candidatus Parcubacteria bacterium]|nr:MAG: glycosyltransferase [Candidatus Parcubacteria bacterium]